MHDHTRGTGTWYATKHVYTYKGSAWVPAFAGTHASNRKIYLKSEIHVSISDYERDQFDAKCCNKKAMPNKVIFTGSMKPINAK